MSPLSTFNIPIKARKPPRQPQRVDVAAAAVQQALDAIETARLLEEVREALGADTVDAFALTFPSTTSRQ